MFDIESLASEILPIQ